MFCTLCTLCTCDFYFLYMLQSFTSLLRREMACFILLISKPLVPIKFKDNLKHFASIMTWHYWEATAKTWRYIFRWRSLLGSPQHQLKTLRSQQRWFIRDCLPCARWRAWRSYPIAGPTDDMFCPQKRWPGKYNCDEISHTERIQDSEQTRKEKYWHSQ